MRIITVALGVVTLLIVSTSTAVFIDVAILLTWRRDMMEQPGGQRISPRGERLRFAALDLVRFACYTRAIVSALRASVLSVSPLCAH